MGEIVQESDPALKRFTADHVRMVEDAAKRSDKLPSEIFIEDWGTMGIKRPTVRRES